MSSIDSFRTAFDGLRQSFEAGRVAHAYLLVGSPRGSALALAESFLQLLVCKDKDAPCGTCIECNQVKEHTHPDVMWVRPESRSRKIDVDQIRLVNSNLSQTSFSGGWKAGVLLHADRMTEGAANAFLKTLEEPSKMTVLLLVTDCAQHLLPTIISRCQRILVGSTEDIDRQTPWHEALLELLREGAPADVLQNSAQASRFKAILDEVKKTVTAQAEDETEDIDDDEDVIDALISSRVMEARSQLMQTILLWNRDVLLTVLQAGNGVLMFPEEAAAIERQASGLSYEQALARVRAVEEMARRMERHLPDEAVFEMGLCAGTR